MSGFHEFIKLVTGTELDSPLPPPKAAAAQLKEKSLFAIKSWREKFGEGYPKLVLGYNHLKLNKKVKGASLAVCRPLTNLAYRSTLKVLLPTPRL